MRNNMKVISSTGLINYQQESRDRKEGAERPRCLVMERCTTNGAKRNQKRRDYQCVSRSVRFFLLYLNFLFRFTLETREREREELRLLSHTPMMSSKGPATKHRQTPLSLFWPAKDG